jgi:anti-anti-sigma factor
VASFRFTTKVSGEEATVHTHGYLSRTAGEQLEAEIVRLLDAGARRFVINLRETDLINSVGISILIGVIERVRVQGGELAFAQLTSVNEEIFRIMGLHLHARLLRGEEGEPADGRGND